MKTETDHTQEIIRRLKADNPDFTIVKHCDRFTVGVPDMSITNPLTHKTIWIENKKLKTQKNHVLKPKSWVDNTAQLMMCCQLNAYYLVIDPFKGDFILMRARRVLVFYRNQTVIMPDPGEYLACVGLDVAYKNLNQFLRGKLK